MTEENRRKHERLSRRAHVYTGENYTPQTSQSDTRYRGSQGRDKSDIRYRGSQGGDKSDIRYRGSQGRDKSDTAYRGSQGRNKSDIRYRGSQGRNKSDIRYRGSQGGDKSDIRYRGSQSRKRADAKREKGFQEKLRSHRLGRLRRVLYCFGGLAAAAYIGAAVYFGLHFYEETVILGMDCSQMTAEEVKKAAAKKLGAYELKILEREDQTETIGAKEIALNFVDDGSIDEMLTAQRSYFWPVMMFLAKGRADSVAFSYNRDAAAERINTLMCMDSIRAVPPRDAYIEAGEYGFEVVEEVMGTTLDKDKTKELLFACLDKGKNQVSLDEEDCYINPQIYHDNKELMRDAASMSELASADISLDFGSVQEVVDASVMRDWIVEISDGVFAIDDACVEQYVEELAAKYDTFGLPLEFQTSLGTTVTLSGGDYGWCLDQGETLLALRTAMDEGYRGTLEPVYLYSAMSHENNGIGYTYVEICLSQQRMWCYENGNLIVDTPVVTGNPNKGNATPSGGVWAIDAKKQNAILTGEGYTSPVDYWMPFNGDVGIHDLKERAYFGGSIYLSNGSHGCVNTPYEQVQTIYNAVSIGTPVIVYE
mgnify:CR=1 FL=1